MPDLVTRWHRVLVGDEHVGDIAQRGDYTRFLFADDYWERPDRPVLGMWFEDNPRASPSSSLRLPPWFSNLLPEGIMRDWIARDRGVSSQREIELLLRIGADLPGAVRVVEGGEERSSDWIGEPLNQVPSPTDSPRLKFSLAGVGVKFSMLRERDRLVMPASDVLGDWIVKLPDPQFSDVPTNEAAMMTLAARSGIDTPEHQLVERDELMGLPDSAWLSSESTAYAVKRFDRTVDGARVHIEDFAQVRGKYPGDQKYEGSFETVAALAYRGVDVASLREWARRIVFNIAIGNGDAHLKNWSLRYADKQRPSLAPVYDLVSTVQHMPNDDLGLTFTGTREFSRVRSGGFQAVERRLGADGSDLEAYAAQTLHAVIASIDEVADLYPTQRGTLSWIAENSVRVRVQLGL